MKVSHDERTIKKLHRAEDALCVDETFRFRSFASLTSSCIPCSSNEGGHGKMIHPDHARALPEVFCTNSDPTINRLACTRRKFNEPDTMTPDALFFVK